MCTQQDKTMQTLDSYLKENFDNGVIDHAIRAHVDEQGWVTFYIHPLNVSGETLDFSVTANNLRCRTKAPDDGENHLCKTSDGSKIRIIKLAEDLT